MNFDWQNLAALSVVVAAAVYLTRVAWRSMSRPKASGCGSCGNCPSGVEDQPRLFAIERVADLQPAGSNPELASKAVEQS